MPEAAVRMEFRVRAKRLNAHGSVAESEDASIALDTGMAGRRDAFNAAARGAAGCAASHGIHRL
jgi:hypothetical protein